ACRMTVGPSPFLICAIGRRVAPQASSCGECGMFTKPVCLPALSKSMLVLAVEVRAMMGCFCLWSSGGNFRRGVRATSRRSNRSGSDRRERLGQRGADPLLRQLVELAGAQLDVDEGVEPAQQFGAALLHADIGRREGQDELLV